MGIMTGGRNVNHATLQHYKFLAHTLQNNWFAEVVGWAGGLHDEDEVVRRMNALAQFLLQQSKDVRSQHVA